MSWTAGGFPCSRNRQEVYRDFRVLCDARVRDTRSERDLHQDPSWRRYEENAHRPAIKTLMAGWGGWQMLMQMRQCGCEGLVTERCAYAPILGALWRDFENGERGVRLAESFAMFRLLTDQRNFPEGLRGYHLYFLEKEGVFRNRISRQYVNVEVKDAGSFGVGRKWKLVDVKLTELQKKELDLLYRDMMDFVNKRKAETNRRFP